MKFVYVAPRLLPVDVGYPSHMSGERPIVVDPNSDSVAQRGASQCPNKALAGLNARHVAVTCELWLTPAVVAHLSPVVFDFLPDTDYGPDATTPIV